MKVIYTEQLIKNREAGLLDLTIEKGKGIYKKVMDAFTGDTGTAKEMISGLQEEEMEKQLAEEAIKSGPQDPSTLDINPDDFSESEIKISDALYKKKDIKIGYFTYSSGVYIERSIRPEYMFYAQTTNNNVLMSWCYDWNDYRAFVLENIVFVEDISKE